MGDRTELFKRFLPILVVASAPFYEVLLLVYIQPPPLNYIVASLPPAIIAFYVYQVLKRREKLFVKQILSTWTYDQRKHLKEYAELLKKKRKKNRSIDQPKI